LQAVELYRRACDIDESDPEEGMLLYQRVLRLDKHHDSAMSNLGRLYFLRGQYGAAETWWTRALEVNPTQVEASYNLGYLNLQRGDFASAITRFREVLQTNETYADAHFNLASVLETVDRHQEARVHWRRYVQLGGEFTREALMALGMRVVK